MSSTELFDTVLRGRPAAGSRRRHPWLAPGLLLPLAAVVVLAFAVWIPQWFTAFDPDAIDTNAILEAPSGIHWFGTDELGRDLFSRIVYGTSQSLTIGIGATVIACFGGVILGTAAALSPKPISRLLVRVIDILLAFPEILLALLVIAVLGRGPLNTLLAVGLSSIAGYARLIRSQVLQVKLSGYVEHAVALGEHPWTIIIEHIVPNAVRPLVILATIGVGASVLTASALSFLGLGVVPPAAEWGALLANGRNFIDIAPWTSLLPATVVAVSVISITLVARRLQTLLARGDA
ncbi:ABC transporter permease [Rhizobium leguminosarum]|uniref:ABC transporter permease n=1 Tax=Rhizobium leguminosarum TaxID=384 RepID=UPI001C94E98E|nr:ABC transporter permease [Rhizobium leguminosarum]MBY5816436.1 ABC transporter permease [Rhizobium leguminosarum]